MMGPLKKRKEEDQKEKNTTITYKMQLTELMSSNLSLKTLKEMELM